MSKINLFSMRYILIIFFLVVKSAAFSTDYYVSNKGNDTNDGLSKETAWQTVAKVNSQSFQPGDNIFFERGGVWIDERLLISSSGTENNRITYSAYGEGEKPVFDGVHEVPGWKNQSNWTNRGSNVWSISLSGSNHGRLWFDGTEKERSRYDAEGQGITEDYPWQKRNRTLYVYSGANPASVYTSLKVTNSSNFFASGSSNEKNYITLSHLDIRGWERTTLSGSSYWIIEHCNIGWNSSAYGLEILKGENTFSEGGIVRHCTFDSGLPFFHIKVNFEDGGYDYSPQYGIAAVRGGVINWDFHDNFFKGWAHANFNFTNHNRPYPTEGLRFYNNYVTSEGYNYGRAFGGHVQLEQANKDNPNEIFNNVFYESSVQSQIGVPYLRVYNNIFNKSRGNDDKGDSDANGLSFSGYTGRPAYKMKIYNNVFANNAYFGLFWPVRADRDPVESCEVVNNIFYNNGANSSGRQFHVNNAEGKVINPVFNNNLFYSKENGPDNVIRVYDTYMNAETFNALDGTGHQGWKPSGNIYGDPLFVDPENGDFSLQPGSPAIGAGLAPLTAYDMDGVKWEGPHNIGPLQFKSSQEKPDSTELFTLNIETEGAGFIIINETPVTKSVYVTDPKTISIEAIPDTGWTFSNWEGDVSGSENPVVVKVDNDKTITAVFTRNSYTLTITYEGEGIVTVDPHHESYYTGEMIYLEAMETREGWRFEEWDGDLISTSTGISFAIESDMNIIARFSNVVTGSVVLPGADKKAIIYPNPAKDFFRISIEDSDVTPEGFRIIDLAGKMVYSDNIHSNNVDVHIPGNIKSGIYIVELLVNNSPYYTQRLVIRH